MSQAIEAMLLKWNNSAAGATITLLLPDEYTLEPFKRMKTGRSFGQRLGVAFAVIGDDETTKTVEPKKPKDDVLTHIATLCSKPEFLKFLSEKFRSVSNSEGAADVVRWHCDVDSRKDISKNPVALELWNQLYQDFKEWSLEPMYDGT